MTDPRGITARTLYDALGRTTASIAKVTTDGLVGAQTNVTTLFSYDSAGRLASRTAVNQVTRAYNGFGQLTSEWQDHTGLVRTATTPRVQYAYSEALGGNHSRLTRTTYPSGYAVNYAYDAGIDSAVSRPSRLSGQRATTTTTATLEAFRYLGSGTVIERSRPEVNVTLSMVNFSGATADAGDKYTGLDRFGRVADQRWTQGTTATSAVVDRYGYTYDRNSNRLTRTNTHPNSLAATFSETYAYDNLNQLQSFTRTGGTTTSQQWQFDALGNWTTLTANGVAQARTADAQNELTQVGNSALAYSTTGNLTTDAQGRTFAYDAWNRLVSVKNAGTDVALYEYDGLNRRIVEQVITPAASSAASARVRDVFYSEDWQVLEERPRSRPTQVGTTADTRFIWSPVYVDAMVARDRNADRNPATGTGGLEQRVYALQDANWNTTAIIAATGVSGVSAGNVINRFAYTPYGEVQTLTASWATPPAASTPAVQWSHLFQGLEFTDVTGLAYVRHRDYSASLGRFIELDPIGFSAGDNNWYRFVGNGPTGKVDPSGLDWLDNYGNWFNGVFGSGYSSTVGGYIHSGLNTAGVSDATLANMTANQALAGTALVAVPVGVGLFAGGEVVLGVGTLGAAGSQLTVTAGTIAAHPATPAVIYGIAEAAAGIDTPGGLDDLARFGAKTACSRAARRCAAPRTIARVGDLTTQEKAALDRVWVGGPRSALSLETREALAAHYRRIGTSAANPAGYAQQAFQEARARYLLGQGPNPGPNVHEFSRRTGFPIYRRGGGK